MRRKRGDDITGGSRGFKTINPHDGKFLITLCDKNEGNLPLLWWSRLDRPPPPPSAALDVFIVRKRKCEDCLGLGLKKYTEKILYITIE